jgi:hypothetical protein
MVSLRHLTRKSLCKKFDYKCATNSASDAFDCDQIATGELTEPPHTLFPPEATLKNQRDANGWSTKLVGRLMIQENRISFRANRAAGGAAFSPPFRLGF